MQAEQATGEPEAVSKKCSAHATGNTMQLPARPKVEQWQEAQHMALSQQLLAKLQSIRMEAALLLQACASACTAQEELQAQARSIEMLVAASSNMAQHDSDTIDDAMHGVQQAMEKHQAAVEAVHAGLVSLSLHDVTAHAELPSLMLPVATAFNRVWNQRRSPLLNLPEAPLAAIFRAAGQHARLVCRQAADVYGAPGTTLVWDARQLRKLTHAAQMQHLAALVASWRWREQVLELRLPIAVYLDEPARHALAAALPNLQRLGLVATCRRTPGSAHDDGLQEPQPLGAPAAGEGGDGAWPLDVIPPPSAPAGAATVAAARPPLPTLAALTALRCCVPEGWQLDAAIPFALPTLRHLELQADAAPRNGLGAVLRPLVGLTHLRLQLRCGGAMPAAHLGDLQAALTALAASLRSLHLGYGCNPDVLPRAVLLRLTQLRSLTVDGSFWDDRCVVPPLQELPGLQYLQLTGPEIWVRSVAPLDDVLACGSPTLRTLHLPLLQLRDASFGPSVHHVLRDLWRRLPEVTCLSVGCMGGRAYHWQPGSLVPTGRSPWLPGVEHASHLAQLSIAVDVLQLAQVACLQALPALTALEVCMLGDLLLEPLADDAAAAELGRLARLRALRLGMKGGPVGVRQSVLALALQCVRQVACLPELRELDLTGLGPLRDEHAAQLGALLAPGCGVRRLVVHDATGGCVPGVKGRERLEALVAARQAGAMGCGGGALDGANGGGGQGPGGGASGSIGSVSSGSAAEAVQHPQDTNPGQSAGTGGGQAAGAGGRGEGLVLLQLLRLHSKLQVEWSGDKGRWFD